MREAMLLALAAVLEVGGDALVRWGLKGGRWYGLALGAAVLFGYGLSVNLPKWDFGRLMGVYIAAFFVVAQAVAVVFFHERLHVLEQRLLTRVARVEVAGEGDLVEPQARLARGALERVQPVLAALVLGDRERDPLLRLERELTVPELRPEACVRACP